LTVPTAPLPLLLLLVLDAAAGLARLVVVGFRFAVLLVLRPFEAALPLDRLAVLRLAGARFFVVLLERFCPLDWLLAISSFPCHENTVTHLPTRSRRRVGQRDR
jgi:hypothetical protein